MSHQSELIETDIHAYLEQHENKELLRFLTCGSVDDGKSTLIGRLLYDSKMIYEDQLAAVKNASIKHGTTDFDFDPALLTDGLKAEREQGITIDVAYRYFSTSKRKFIIADTPGHEQYTRNMATGASTCDLAIILIDARYGVLTQTRRHSFIVALLGIKHVIVAINKMDLVDFSEERFDEIRRDYSAFVADLGVPDVRFVPISALNGDNVVNTSDLTDWYEGASLMHMLENVHIASDRNLRDFRFPVQIVNRPNLDFRGFCGTIASGTIHPGDEVIVLPSRKTSRVAAVVTYDGELDEAFAPMAVTLTLTDEIDVSRGDMIALRENVPRVDTNVDATVVWMAEEALVAGKQYFVKHATRRTPAVVTAISHRVDINTLERSPASELGLNEIGVITVSLSQPIAFDPYDRNRATGAMILIDRITNNTVGAAMILEDGRDDDSRRSTFELYDGLKSVDVRVRDSLVPAAQRQARIGHTPATIWLTGPTGSGKRTVAYALEQRLFDAGYLAKVIDGYSARLGLSLDLRSRDPATGENLRRTAEVARLFNQAGLIAICACLSPTGEGRGWAERIVSRDPGAPFFKVWLSAPADVCADRMSEAAGFVDPAYEPPQAADLAVPTHELNLDESVDRIMELLRDAKLITPA